MEELASLLEPILLGDNGAACAAAVRLIEEGEGERKLWALALLWLRKLAHRSYAEGFRSLAARLDAALPSNDSRLSSIVDKLAEIEMLFRARMAEGRRYRDESEPSPDLSSGESE
jgi:TPR repeat protein